MKSVLSRQLAIERYPVDATHVIVQLRRCPTCSQAFLAISMEFVDWEGGDDTEYREAIPVTPAEADTLVSHGDHLDIPFIEALATSRRYLSRTGRVVGARYRQRPSK